MPTKDAEHYQTNGTRIDTKRKQNSSNEMKMYLQPLPGITVITSEYVNPQMMESQLFWLSKQVRVLSPKTDKD